MSPFEQVVEEERIGDPDQADDNQNFPRASYTCESIESELGTNAKKIALATPGSEKFRFFLDGSLRTKYLGEYVEGFGGFPLIASEIAVSVIKKEATSLRPASLLNRVYLIFPHKDTGLISDSTFDRLEKTQSELDKADSLTRIEFLKKTGTLPDPRASVLAKARGVMHQLEHEVATSIPRKDSEWLIMDGAIRSYEFSKLENTVGLAKSFSRKPLLSVGGKTMTIPSYMSHLKEGERSAVFKIIKPSNPLLTEVAFWYIRLRIFPPMEPLGGIVKVDLHIDPSLTSLDASLVDLVDGISAEIYKMRLPTVYPWPRWPSYIYPIRVAEVYMASSFLSPFVLGRIGNELKLAMGGP
jgi:hypothetical protein